MSEFLQTNYLLTLARWQLRCLLDDWRRRKLLVVYQAGKVGSSTIMASLKVLPNIWRVHHVHTLTAEGIATREAIYRKLTQERASSYFPRACHLLSSRYLRKKLPTAADDVLPAARWKVITLVREPIGRNISEFFQVIDAKLPNFVTRYNAGALTIDETVQTFWECFDHDDALHWFDQEIKPVLGIDVFAEPFPKVQGYQIYHGPFADLLLLKLEQIDECAGAAFGEFLGLENFRLVKTNVAEEKAYAAAYKEFKQRIALSPAYLQRMVGSRYVQHFYSDAEIDAMCAKW